MGIISLLPAGIAIVLCFLTKNTVISLAIASIVGCLCLGDGLFGFPALLRSAVGTTDFAGVALLNIFVSILVAYFQRTGAIQSFSEKISARNLTRKGAQIIAWILGMFVYFSDSFSPLFVGSTMRAVTDKARISREKLAYIADSTSAPVSVLVPITGWAAYLSGLAVGVGCIATAEDAALLFVKAIPLNFYPILAILLVGLIGSGIIRDFGPMKRAEARAVREGKVMRDDAKPLSASELTDMQPLSGIKPRIFINFILPIVLIVAIALTTFFVNKSANTRAAFMTVIILMTISLRVQGFSLNDISDVMMKGIKGAMPAITLLALAYCVNQLSKEMGTAAFILSVCGDALDSKMLPALIFIFASIMAFATGSSWGTFAICMPIALPLAFELSNGVLSPMVVAVFAAVAGGGVFGDHCSPLSDTTILSSTGAACDHLDHVKTQLPYALICGALAWIFYLVVGFLA